jgi:RHS repeat-associated protein
MAMNIASRLFVSHFLRLQAVLLVLCCASLAHAGSTWGPDSHGKPCPDNSCCQPPCTGPGGSSSGMPSYSVNLMSIGVIVEDTPLSYKPSIGPAVDFKLTYNQKDVDQPSPIPFGNFGPLWAFNWLEYIQDDPAQAGSNVMLYLSNGQGRLYGGYNSGTGSFTMEPQTGAVLVRTSVSPITYERRLPDGSKEVFSASDGSSSYPRRIFLKQRIDALGNAVTMTYDAQMRLVGIADARGQTSVLHYDHPTNSLLVTGIDDPFGRSVGFAYDASGNLYSITDAIGMTSSFAYGSGSAMQSMTTPYGTTSFDYHVQNPPPNANYRFWLIVTDPLGHASRYEFRHQAPGIGSTDPSNQIPAVPSVTITNNYFQYRNSFYWDAHVYAPFAAGATLDYTKARIQHWLHETGTSPVLTADTLESVKYPLEWRQWYFYYTTSGTPTNFSGTFNKPKYVARKLADGVTTQLTQRFYGTNAFGNATQTIDPSGLITDNTYAANGNDVLQIDHHNADNSYHTTESYTYNSQHEPLTHTDENGKTTTYTYNAAGQKLTETDPLGHTTTWVYDANGYPLSVTDANGHAVSYTYDAIGRVHTETDAQNNTKTFTYDALNRVTRIDYWDSTYEQNVYDKLDRTEHRDRLGHVTHYQYDNARNLTQVTNPAGDITHYTYYENNLLHTQTDAGSGLTTWDRDIEGRVTQRHDPNGGTTTFHYDNANRKDYEINALNQRTDFSYDVNGRLTRTKDANGTITDRTYNLRGWLLTLTVRANADGSPSTADATTTLNYDAMGNVISVTDPDGAAIMSSYDNAHRLVGIADSLDNHISYTLDGVGNRTLEKNLAHNNDLMRALARTYNARNQVVRERDGVGNVTTFSYDANRNRSGQVDALGVTTAWNYDAESRLTSTVQAGAVTTGFGYDDANRLTGVTDPDGLATGYAVDGMGRVTATLSPDTGETDVVYDSAGNRISQTDANGITATYGYDLLNRITGIGYPDSSLDIAYHYDEANTVTGCAESYPVGRLTSMTDHSGSTTYCYDRRGNVTSKTQVTNGDVLVTQYTWTLANRLASITYPSGALVTYARDAAGRVNGVTYQPSGGSQQTLISGVNYYPFGPVQAVIFGNGHRLNKTYDKSYTIKSIASPGTNGLKLNFTVDAMHNIVGASTPPQQASYAYDDLYRLTQVEDGASNVLEAYTYNATGDRLSKTYQGATDAYTYTSPLISHQVQDIHGINRDYDANGNLADIVSYGQGTGSTRTFEYDDRNRMARESLRSGCWNCVPITTDYDYNGRGERVIKSATVDSRLRKEVTTTDYVYNEAGQLLGEYPGTSNVTPAEYIYLVSTPVAYVTDGTLYYVETDQLGTPRDLVLPGPTKDTDTIVWKWDYFGSAFGEDYPDEDPDGDGNSLTFNLRFPGQYYDAETGLHYNYFRDYEPGTGRYVESDPIGLGGGIDTYAYVASNPLNAIDFLGLSNCKLKPVTVCCLAKVFGKSKGDVTRVKIQPNSMRAKIFRTAAGQSGDFATTLPDQIMLTGDCNSFEGANWWQLHEFYHVFEQWDTGRLTQANYLPHHKQWENEANQFADTNLGAFEKCLSRGCKCAGQ